MVHSEDEGLGHFEIDDESGDIRTTELFVQGTKPFYTLKMRAKDSGAPPLEDSAVIHIQVRSALVFKSDYYSVSARSALLFSDRVLDIMVVH